MLYVMANDDVIDNNAWLPWRRLSAVIGVYTGELC